jgi:hypothetical protein
MGAHFGLSFIAMVIANCLEVLSILLLLIRSPYSKEIVRGLPTVAMNYE